MALNSQKIEQIAIEKVSGEITNCKTATASLSSNDKTPSFDGSIFLYSNSSLEKNRLKGIVSVQVKGKHTSRDNLKLDLIKYPVQISDLRNYRQNGGIIYFVVYIENNTNYKIFYNALLPLDLEAILSKTRKCQKTKNISLTPFPSNDEDRIISILSNFIRESKKQHSTASASYLDITKLTEFDQFSFSATSPHGNPFELFTLPTYLYGQIGNCNVQIPLMKINIEKIATNNINLNVSLNGQVD